MTGLVSVVISAHERTVFILRCVNSVLKQSYKKNPTNTMIKKLKKFY